MLYKYIIINNNYYCIGAYPVQQENSTESASAAVLKASRHPPDTVIPAALLPHWPEHDCRGVNRLRARGRNYPYSRWRLGCDGELLTLTLHA